MEDQDIVGKLLKEKLCLTLYKSNIITNVKIYQQVF